MIDNGFDKLRPGDGRISASNLNEAIANLELGNKRSTPIGSLSTIEEHPSGVVHDVHDQSIKIRITGGSNPYSWEEVFQAGTVDNPLFPGDRTSGPPPWPIGAAESWRTTGRKGMLADLTTSPATRAELPAYEQGGDSDVPVGTVVDAWMNEVNSSLFFTYTAKTIWQARAYTPKLPAYTRTGNKITFDAVGDTPIDGLTMLANDKILYNPLTPDGGVWVYRVPGDDNTKTVLERALDAATNTLGSADAPGSLVDVDGVSLVSGSVRAGMLVQIGPEGTSFPSTLWQLVTPPDIVLNTTALTFVPLAFPQQVKITSQTKVLCTGAGGVEYLYPGTLYNYDLTAGGPIWVGETSGLTATNQRVPALSTFYPGVRGADADLVGGGDPRPRYNISAPEKIKGVLSTNLTYRSSATMRIWDYNGGETDTGIDIEVWDYLLAPNDIVQSGTNAYAFWRGRWYVDETACYTSLASLVNALLTADGGLTGTYP